MWVCGYVDMWIWVRGAYVHIRIYVLCYTFYVSMQVNNIYKYIDFHSFHVFMPHHYELQLRGDGQFPN
jgi:hypothetical protein